MRSVSRTWRLAAAAIVGLSLVSSAQAALIFSTNFNNPDVNDGQATFSDPDVADTTAVPGWVVFSSVSGDGIVTGGIWDPDNVDYPGSLGNNTPLPGAGGAGQAAFLFLGNETSENPLGISLTNVASLATIGNNLTYTFTVAVGVGNSYTNGQVSLQLLAGDMVMEETFIEAGEITNKGTFNDYVVSYITAANDPFAGSELRVRMVHTFGGVDDASVDFTNVRVDVIPEPASATLLLGGLATAALRRQRRR